MQKIPTMFFRDETVKGHPVVDRVKPECQWVLDGEGLPTVKLDGTNVKIDKGVLYKRQKPKDRDYDNASYVECQRNDPSDRWAFEAFDVLVQLGPSVFDNGIYELVGPKVQGNPQKESTHKLYRVVPPSDRTMRLTKPPTRTFDGLRTFLAAWYVEGLVFHHPDGRFAKIKRRDFHLPWPAEPPENT